MAYLDDELTEFAENPDDRCPCILLLDTSASMKGEPIEALNEGLRAFQQDLSKDDLAQRRVEVAIVTFGNGGVRMLQEFVKASDFEAPTLAAKGATPMGEAIELALDTLQKRKQQLREMGVRYYRPWVFLVTDGAPTDDWQAAAQQVHDEEEARALVFFAVGVGNAKMDILAQISARRPVKLRELKFREMFLWVSSSQKRVSASNVGDKVLLPPLDDWSEI
jgi:uncharacterized protein YegL